MPTGKVFDFIIRLADGASASAHICDLMKPKLSALPQCVTADHQRAIGRRRPSAVEFVQHQDGAKARPTDVLETHGGKPQGRCGTECKRVSTTAPDLWGAFLFGFLMRVQLKGARIHERFFTCGQVRDH